MAPGNGRRSRVSVGTMTETSEGEIRSTFERVLGEDVQRMQRTITARHDELDSSTGDELESVKKRVMREMHDELDVIAIEVGAPQLPFVHTVSPVAAVCLNIADDHIDHFGSSSSSTRDHDRGRTEVEQLVGRTLDGRCAVERAGLEPPLCSGQSSR